MKELQITGLILLCILVGIIVGYFRFLPQFILTQLDNLSWWLLAFLLFLVGIDLGMNAIWKILQRIGFRILLLPVGVAVGSLAGAWFAAFLLKLPVNQTMSVGSAFGWYTLSAVILAKLHSPQLGALAFFANVLRELLAFVLIPIFVRYRRQITGIAMGGATPMDTTLVLIDRVAGAEYAAIAFVQGFILSILVPFLVPFFISR